MLSYYILKALGFLACLLPRPVQSRCRYGEMATRLHCNGKGFWPKTD